MNEHMQFLAGEPFSAPPALAREHWRPLAKAMERLDRMWIQQGMYEAETARLREQLGAVKTRDSQALGQALAAGEAEPEPQAPAVEEAEIASNRQRSEAVFGAITEEQRRVSDLIVRHQSGWAGDVQRYLADKAAAYRIAVVEMERARESLVAEVQLGASFRERAASRRPTSCPALPTSKSAARPSTPCGTPCCATRSSCRCAAPCSRRGSFCACSSGKQVVVDRVDADGSVHPQVLEGVAGWLVRDLLNRQK
jgi:hypothetical protein